MPAITTSTENAVVPVPYLVLYHGWVPPAALGAACNGSWGYNAQAPTPLGGSFGFGTGDSLACIAWKLAATVCLTQPVATTAYPLAAAYFSCPAAGLFTDPNGWGAYNASSSYGFYVCTACNCGSRWAQTPAGAVPKCVAGTLTAGPWGAQQPIMMANGLLAPPLPPSPPLPPPPPSPHPPMPSYSVGGGRRKRRALLGRPRDATMTRSAVDDAQQVD